MAKKRKQSAEEQQRQTRKEILRARRHEQQTRRIWLAVLGVVALLLVVLVGGLINELIVKPAQPVSEVNGVEIAMQDWRRRVSLQRAQLIIGIENLAETFGQDIGQVQQFAGQQINLLMDPQTLGQLVLDQMIDDELIRQGAVARGITVSDEEVQERIEESFNYFGGESPTAQPTPTKTAIPTPSLTPVPTAVITEVVPTETPLPDPTVGPTSTPLPTPTAVSLESFEQSLEETLQRLSDLGADEEQFREIIRAGLYEERLREALSEEEGVDQEADQVSFFYLVFDSEEEAQATLEEINSGDYLTVWNTIRSRPIDAVDEGTASANELIWRTQDSVESVLGSEVSSAAFTIPPGEPSEVLVQAAADEEGSDRYFIVYVTGREVRPLSQGAIRSAEQELVASWLEAQRQTGVSTFEVWRANVPRRPILDPRFLVPPTPAPATPTLALPTPVAPE